MVNNVVSRSPPSGSDHPQIVTVDLGQDLSLPAGEIGKYQLTSRDIVKGWRTCSVPILLDMGACVPQRMLILPQGLDRICPGGMQVDPISRENSPMTSANSAALTVVGSINLLCRFSGPSVEVGFDGNRQTTGPPMQYWIPVQAAVIPNLSTEFIMTVSFIRFQEMRIDYTDLPKVATK